jgi:hypothetical protein
MTRMMTMTLEAAGFAGAGAASDQIERAAFALRRASGWAIFAGGVAVLVAHAIVRLHGG